MRILVTGSSGLVGNSVLQAAQRAGMEADGLPRERCELSRLADVRAAVKAGAPEVVVHAAASLDAAGFQKDPALGHRRNVLTTQNVALACSEQDCAVVYLSANLVFDGGKPHPEAYLELDEAHPRSVYGRTKLAGERVSRELSKCVYVVRTSWLFGPRALPGRPDFPQRVLQGAEAGSGLSMVSDLWANPTYVHDLADAILALIQTRAYGTYHLVNEGAASPFELANETLRLAGHELEVEPTKLGNEAPVPAAPNTALRNLAAAENLGISLRPWREALAEYLRAL